MKPTELKLEGLRLMMRSIRPDPGPVPMDEVYRFLAYTQLGEFEDYSQRDMIDVLLHGIPTIQDNPEYAREVLDLWFEYECDHDVEYVLDTIRYFYGVES